MNLFFDKKLSDSYTSQSQKIRVLTEEWVGRQIYCPSCGFSDIGRFENNKPVADFFCKNCREEYELKSKKNFIGTKIVDGAYDTMIHRLSSDNNPNFFFLNYNQRDYSILNFFVIPKYFFIPEIIERRNPLPATARRAGWVGCNILLAGIPQSGKIFYIKDSKIEEKDTVIENWRKTLFLREEKEVVAKGWLLDIMRSIEMIGKKDFVLEDVYKFEEQLSKLHPDNKHIRDKIRQQLQILRDSRYLEFMGRGIYRLS